MKEKESFTSEEVTRLKELAAKPKFFIKFSKIWIVTLEAMFALIVIVSACLCWYGISMAIDYPQTGTRIVDLSVKSINAVGTMASIIGGAIPAVVGILRFLSKRRDLRGPDEEDEADLIGDS